MTGEVVTIHPTMSLHAATGLLGQAGASGAPVVDDAGRCVGFLTAANFLRWAVERPSEEKRPPHRASRLPWSPPHSNNWRITVLSFARMGRHF